MYTLEAPSSDPIKFVRRVSPLSEAPITTIRTLDFVEFDQHQDDDLMIVSWWFSEESTTGGEPTTDQKEEVLEKEYARELYRRYESKGYRRL